MRVSGFFLWGLSGVMCFWGCYLSKGLSSEGSFGFLVFREIFFSFGFYFVVIGIFLKCYCFV